MGGCGGLEVIMLDDSHFERVCGCERSDLGQSYFGRVGGIESLLLDYFIFGRVWCLERYDSAQFLLWQFVVVLKSDFGKGLCKEVWWS